MSDDYKAERIPALPGTSEFPGGHSLPRRRAYRAYATSVAHDHVLDEVDVASILGAPASSLSPESLRALQRILADAGDLRRQLDAAEHHRRHLEDQADLYPGLPCLNGHAFLRELDAFMIEDAGRDGEEWARLWVIQADGLDHVVGQQGLGMGEAILKAIYNALHQVASDGEPLAYFGFGLFSWLMIGTDQGESDRRLNAFLDAAKQEAVAITCGSSPLVVGKNAALALEDAEAERLRLTQAKA